MISPYPVIEVSAECRTESRRGKPDAIERACTVLTTDVVSIEDMRACALVFLMVGNVLLDPDINDTDARFAALQILSSRIPA